MGGDHPTQPVQQVLSDNPTLAHQSIHLFKSRPMFHVKICGVRKPEDVEAVASAGGDAIGLNFFPPSARYLDPTNQSARLLSDLAKELRLIRVGVMVNRSPESIAEVVRSVGLDVIQLHGDESLEELHQLQSMISLPVIRAVKLPRRPLSVAEIDRECEPWVKAGCHLLLDADAGREHGGSGKTLDWNSLGRWARQQTCDWTLAGGLTPENVAGAIEATSVNSVDTASGAEKSRGQKDAGRITAFCRATGLVH